MDDFTARVMAGSATPDGVGASGRAGPGSRQAAARRSLLAGVLLGGILLLGAGLRLAGIDWDRGHFIHPDERRILMAVAELRWPEAGEWTQVLGPRSPLNPRFFAYGSLPLYLLRLAAIPFGVDLYRLSLVGRALSAVYDLLTVAAIYLVGRRLWGRGVGLAGAALLAVAVLPIQLSHYLTVDTLLTLLSTLAVFALMRVAETGSLPAGVAAGALTGLALASKTSALPLLPVAGVAWAAWVLARPEPARLLRGALGLSVGVAAAGGGFLLGEPYSLWDWFRFGSALLQESAMAQGLVDLPYTRQYIGTVPYLYPLRQMVVWSLGVPLGLLGLAGVLGLSWRAWRERRGSEVVLAAWFWTYFALAGALHAKFSRYMAPLIPWLCLAGAALLGELWRRAQGRRALERLILGLGGSVLAATLLYALAFAGLYTRPHPWLAASEWICRQVPPGSVIAVEWWDDPLPLRPDERCSTLYEQVWLDPHGLDRTGQVERLAESLARADYVVLSSQRLYGALGRLPERYPLAARYYALLFGERLGFRLVDVRTNYPRLGPLALVDEPLAGTGLPRPALLERYRPAPLVLSPGRADESYSVYDHPRTLVFEKKEALPMEELKALLEGGG